MLQLAGGQQVQATLQSIFAQIQTNSDLESRTGFTLAIGFIYRAAGGANNARNLQSAVSILSALSKDPVPLVQVRPKLLKLHVINVSDMRPACTFRDSRECDIRVYTTYPSHARFSHSTIAGDSNHRCRCAAVRRHRM